LDPRSNGSRACEMPHLFASWMRKKLDGPHLIFCLEVTRSWTPGPPVQCSSLRSTFGILEAQREARPCYFPSPRVKVPFNFLSFEFFEPGSNRVENDRLFGLLVCLIGFDDMGLDGSRSEQDNPLHCSRMNEDGDTMARRGRPRRRHSVVWPLRKSR
jgi:hypothetical protein